VTRLLINSLQFKTLILFFTKLELTPKKNLRSVKVDVLNQKVANNLAFYFQILLTKPQKITILY
jgi:hypothetical protein